MTVLVCKNCAYAVSVECPMCRSDEHLLPVVDREKAVEKDNSMITVGTVKVKVGPCANGCYAEAERFHESYGELVGPPLTGNICWESELISVSNIPTITEAMRKVTDMANKLGWDIEWDV